jgi:MYXO-CTERM domain-containing protein
MCDGQCEAGSGHASCVAECQASVKARCNASCQGHPGTVDCHASCQASCQGQCDVQANASCDVMCQDSLHVSCTSKLTGGCKTQCTEPKGALFCNGQYVDVGNNLQSCEDALKAALNITVTAHADASGESSCTSGQGCEASGQAKASASCALAPGFSGSAPSGWILAGLGLAAFGARRRRRS